MLGFVGRGGHGVEMGGCFQLGDGAFVEDEIAEWGRVVSALREGTVWEVGMVRRTEEEDSFTVVSSAHERPRLR